LTAAAELPGASIVACARLSWAASMIVGEPAVTDAEDTPRSGPSDRATDCPPQPAITAAASNVTDRA